MIGRGSELGAAYRNRTDDLRITRSDPSVQGSTGSLLPSTPESSVQPSLRSSRVVVSNPLARSDGCCRQCCCILALPGRPARAARPARSVDQADGLHSAPRSVDSDHQLGRMSALRSSTSRAPGEWTYWPTVSCCEAQQIAVPSGRQRARSARQEHLIRRELQACPLLAHSSAELLKHCSLMRSRQ